MSEIKTVKILQTDVEVICAFMEEKPTGGRRHGTIQDGEGNVTYAVFPFSENGWWKYDLDFKHWEANGDMSLNELHEVEAKLEGQARLDYVNALLDNTYDGEGGTHWRLIHAFAEEKIKALAAVLRKMGGQQQS